MTTLTEVPVSDFLQSLSRSEYLQRFFDHPDRERIANGPLDRDQVATIVGQYWYPINYFVTFLPRVIAAVPDLAMKTKISIILWQELGEGNPAMAHETLYIDTMVKRAGLDRRTVLESPQLPATQRLMEGYREACEDYRMGLGYLYGTEAIDLSIVSGLAKGVRRGTGQEDLPWLDIHCVQEPDHTASVEETVTLPLTDADEAKILEAAHDLWARWYDFFTDIGDKIYRTA